MNDAAKLQRVRDLLAQAQARIVEVTARVMQERELVTAARQSGSTARASHHGRMAEQAEARLASLQEHVDNLEVSLNRAQHAGQARAARHAPGSPTGMESRRGAAPELPPPSPDHRISAVTERILVIRSPSAGAKKTLSIEADQARSASVSGGSNGRPWILQVTLADGIFAVTVDPTQLVPVRKFAKAVEARRVEAERVASVAAPPKSKPAPRKQKKTEDGSKLPGGKAGRSKIGAPADAPRPRQGNGGAVRTPRVRSTIPSSRPVWLFDRFGKQHCSVEPVAGARCQHFTLSELCAVLLADPVRSEPAILKLAGVSNSAQALRRLRSWRDAGVG